MVGYFYHVNYKRTKHAKVSSPEELGYKIIGPKYYNPDYERQQLNIFVMVQLSLNHGW